MKRSPALFIACALVFGLAACGKHSDVHTVSAGANAPQAGGPVVVASGTTFYGKLEAPISTKTSADGSTFALDETDTMLHKDAALHGAVIDGHLEGVHAAGPLHKPALTLVFDDIRLPDGTKEPVNVQLLSLKAFEPKTHHLRTIGMMVAGGIAGHEAKKHMGHGGALMGAAGGYVVSQALKTDIAVPAGTVIAVKFVSPVTQGSAASTAP